MDDLIWHYTNAEGLHGILTSKKLWLTHYEFMNDRREFDHGLGVIFNYLQNPRFEDAQTNIGRFQTWVSRQVTRQGGERPDPYFVSFAGSGRGDDIQLWMSYGAHGDGYALGFDPAPLRESIADPESLGKVEYCSDLASATSDSVITCRQKIDALTRVFNEEETFLDASIDAGLEIWSVLPFLKALEWRHEDEWRLVVKRDGTIGGDVRSRVRGNLLAPIVELSLGDTLPSLRAIRIGPKPTRVGDHVRLGLETLLHALGVDGVQVVTSESSLQ